MGQARGYEDTDRQGHGSDEWAMGNRTSKSAPPNDSRAHVCICVEAELNNTSTRSLHQSRLPFITNLTTTCTRAGACKRVICVVAATECLASVFR